MNLNIIKFYYDKMWKNHILIENEQKKSSKRIFVKLENFHLLKSNF